MNLFLSDRTIFTASFVALFGLLLVLSLTPAHGQFGGSVPSPTTASAEWVTGDTAVLFGTVNPNNSPTSAWFEYGATAVLGTRTSAENVGSGNFGVRIATTLAGLQPNTTYFFRLVAQNSFGVQAGSSQTFRTGNQVAPSAPQVKTGAADQITRTSVALHGTVEPQGNDLAAWFEYGTAANPANRSETRLVGRENSTFTLNFFLGGLQAETTYYYRLAAQGPQGVIRGEVKNFKTLPAPAPAPTPPANGTSTPPANAT